jgi:hypothetical protein
MPHGFHSPRIGFRLWRRRFDKWPERAHARMWPVVQGSEAELSISCLFVANSGRPAAARLVGAARLIE